MFCPDDSVAMRQVKIIAHYGEPIFLEQCPQCGGIWFDKAELYRAKSGEAEKIELLDSEILTNPSVIQNTRLACPKDRAELIRFSDKYFPSGIIVARCPVCDGFWLNRGEFIKYQTVRRDLQRPEEPGAVDAALSAKLQEILAAYPSDSKYDALGRLGKFLATPVDDIEAGTEGSAAGPPREANVMDIAFNVLTAILNFLVTRRMF